MPPTCSSTVCARFANALRDGVARHDRRSLIVVRVLVAMSGGVDSSVAAARLVAEGHEVVGVTMRLWGGESDTGCCSVSDVDDARRVAQQVGIDHLVFNFSDDFEARVVDHYVRSHASGVTPNPCIECNRHLKFDRLLERARLLGFDAVATGHHARIAPDPSGRLRVARGADVEKDQSYVVHVLAGDALERIWFPVGDSEKSTVRGEAAALGLRTAAKPDSQDVCFIGRSGGRGEFLGRRIPLSPATVVDRDGTRLGEVSAVELVTVGQRRGIGLPGGGPKRFVLDVDVDGRQVVVGDETGLLRDRLDVTEVVWPHRADPVELDGARIRVQSSAHGASLAGRLEVVDARSVTIRLDTPVRRVAPGQSVVWYDESDTFVLGGGLACA